MCDLSVIDTHQWAAGLFLSPYIQTHNKLIVLIYVKSNYFKLCIPFAILSKELKDMHFVNI